MFMGSGLAFAVDGKRRDSVVVHIDVACVVGAEHAKLVAFGDEEALTILACVVKHAVQRSLYGRLFCTNTRSPCHSR